MSLDSECYFDKESVSQLGLSQGYGTTSEYIRMNLLLTNEVCLILWSTNEKMQHVFSESNVTYNSSNIVMVIGPSR